MQERYVFTTADRLNTSVGFLPPLSAIDIDGKKQSRTKMMTLKYFIFKKNLVRKKNCTTPHGDGATFFEYFIAV
jgi:hypothetical protein